MDANRNWRWVVLKHLLRRKHILSRCREKFRGAAYFHEYPEFVLIYQLLVAYWDKWSDLISGDMLRVAFFEKLEDPAHPPEFAVSEEFLRGLLNDIHEAYKPDVEWSDAPVMEAITADMQDRSLSDLLAEVAGVSAEDDPAALQRALKKAAEPFDKGVFGGLKIDGSLSDIDGNLAAARRWDIGFQPMDRMSNGVAAGELICFVAPTNSGKTTLCWQIAFENISRKQHVVLISTEQVLKGDLAIRAYCLMANTTRKVLKPGTDARSGSALPPDILKALKNSAPHWDKYLHFIDCTDPDIKTIDELFDPVDYLRSNGVQPALILLDWWGDLKDKLIANNEGADPAMLRSTARTWIARMRWHTRRLEVPMLVFHQMSGAECKKGSQHKPSTHGAQEDTNFNNRFDIGFALSPPDDDHTSILAMDKGRAAGKTHCMIQLDGPNCRFKPAAGPDTSGMLIIPSATKQVNTEPPPPAT